MDNTEQQKEFKIVSVWLKPQMEATLRPLAVIALGIFLIIGLAFGAVVNWQAKGYLVAVVSAGVAVLLMSVVRGALRRLSTLLSLDDGELYGFLGVMNLTEEEADGSEEELRNSVDAICEMLGGGSHYLLPTKMREGLTYTDGTTDIVLEFETDKAGVKILTGVEKEKGGDE